jgi:hypothetical protein
MKDIVSGRAVLLFVAAYAIACWAAWEAPSIPVRQQWQEETVRLTFHIDPKHVTQLAWQMIGPEGRRAFTLGLGCIVAGETVPGFWLGFIDRANWTAMSRRTAGCR